MGDDDLVTSGAHLVLVAVTAHGLTRGYNTAFGRFIHPGCHANLFIHGIIGFVNYTSSLGMDVCQLYPISLAAAKYLPIPFILGDLYWENQNMLSMAHVISGIAPFALEVMGQPNQELGYACTVVNIASLAYCGYTIKCEWCYFCAAAALFTYFAAANVNKKAAFVFPLGLAVIEYCACMVTNDDSSSSPRGKKAKKKSGGSKPSSKKSSRQSSPKRNSPKKKDNKKK